MAGDVDSLGVRSKQGQVHANANLEEVVLDPDGQNAYTADQDNGGIYEFSTVGGTLAALAGSTVGTSLGVTGMETDSNGKHLYVVAPGFPQGQVLTFSRDIEAATGGEQAHADKS